MSKNESVESRKSKVESPSRRKSKVVKWEYVTEPKDVEVYFPHQAVKRKHAPLEPSLSWVERNTEYILHLRSCVQGLDANGTVVKTLYCTRDGRFFVRGKNGWNEQLPSNAKKPRVNSKCGGAYDAPSMAHQGHKYCHRCVAVAWCNPPEYVKATINDQDAERIYEVDHLNTDHKNWTADNLQWVTAAENRRRSKITRAMRAADDDPKLHTREELLRIFIENNVAGDVYEGED